MLLAAPLSADVALNLAEGASFSSSRTAQTIAGLSGSGAFAAKALTLTKRLAGSVQVGCDLTLADGIAIEPAAAPSVVAGCVTFAGGATVVLPTGLDRAGGTLTLLTADSIVGGLSACTFENLPKGMVAELAVKDGSRLVLSWTKRGTSVIVR